MQLILGGDAMSDKKRVNTSRFWSDIIYLGGQLALFSGYHLALLQESHTDNQLPRFSPSSSCSHVT